MQAIKGNYQSLANELESHFSYDYCNYEKLAKKLELPLRFLVSNDAHGRILEKLKTVKVRDLNQDELAVGLVIGESHFLSLANLIQKHAQFWMSVDIDPLVARHLGHQIKCINSNATIDEYMNEYLTFWNDSTLPKNVNLLPDHYEHRISLQMCGQGFLDTPEHYEAAKKAIASMKVVHLNLNMFDPKATGLLGTVLKTYQAQITLLSFGKVGRAACTIAFCTNGKISGWSSA